MENSIGVAGSGRMHSSGTGCLPDLEGSRFALTARLCKAGDNGSTHLKLEDLSVSIGGDKDERHNNPHQPLPSGYREIEVQPGVISSSRPGTMVPASSIIAEAELASMSPNTCIVLNGGNRVALAILKSNGMLRFVPKPPGKDETRTQINPANYRHALGFGLLVDPTISIVALPSVAGTGKTVMALRAGLEVIGKMRSVLRKAGSPNGEQNETGGRPNRIIVCRSPFSVGQTLGYIPGTLQEKTEPWARAVNDALDVLVGVEERKKLILEGDVEVITYEHLRGRSLHDVYLVGDDFQNEDKAGALTFGTRAGHGTKVVVTGDPMQIDNKSIHSGQDGMTQMVRRLHGWKGFGTITFTECLRSELAAEVARRFSVVL